eukprot:11347861-Karenia_brevis.AAC.1
MSAQGRRIANKRLDAASRLYAQNIAERRAACAEAVQPLCHVYDVAIKSVERHEEVEASSMEVLGR